MIKITNLNKIFNENTKREFQALKNINLEIKNSSCVILKGISGSGKSTLLSIIGTLLKPTSGSIVVENENINVVFENLLRGSRNHLMAFNRQLENLGVEYVPVYITQEEFDQIVSTPNETGNGNQSGNQQRRRQYRGGR